mmetsp:Transcript_19028/g.61262  ORF Transcript_19028/g.61262 Transcript_19028/m.61262 type:complete len:118 (-) Transcript_19028:333-686(-)
MDGVNVERLRRYRPGSDFLLLDYDSTTSPPKPPSTPPSPTIVVGDLVPGDMLAVKHPSDSTRFVFGKVLHVDDLADTFTLHYWGTTSRLVCPSPRNTSTPRMESLCSLLAFYLATCR